MSGLLLLMQACYAMAGIAYNLISLNNLKAGRRPLHQGSAWAGLAVMLAYTASLTLALTNLTLAYRIAMSLFIIVLGYGGVITHILRGPTEYYRTRSTWAAAIAINMVGLVLNVTAAIST